MARSSRPFVFGVDLDGVVADYTAGFREIVAEDRGVDPSSLPDERSWDFHEWGLDVDGFNRLHDYAVNERRMLATLPSCVQLIWPVVASRMLS